MALVEVSISSFDSFKDATIGNGYDIDGNFGFQCWDYGALLWGNIGRYGHEGQPYAYPYLQTGALGYAYEIWTDSRIQNAGFQFTLIERLQDVKRGDMVILDKGRFAGDVSGHNAFADEDYNGTTTMLLLGQNQENPNPTTGHVVTSDQMNVTKFLGAFRFKAWNRQPPHYATRHGKFPFYLYANKWRINGR